MTEQYLYCVEGNNLYKRSIRLLTSRKAVAYFFKKLHYETLASLSKNPFDSWQQRRLKIIQDLSIAEWAIQRRPTLLKVFPDEDIETKSIVRKERIEFFTKLFEDYP